MTTHNTQREVERVEKLAMEFCATFYNNTTAWARFSGEQPEWRAVAIEAISLLTRPSVDEEFVEAARALAGRAAQVNEALCDMQISCNKVPMLMDAVNRVCAALASVEGKADYPPHCVKCGEPHSCPYEKPAQPTAVDEQALRRLVRDVIDANGVFEGLMEIRGRLAALERAQAKPDEVFDDQEGKGPCGGRRCFLSHARDGEWIHSSKSYGSCSVRRDRMEETVRAAYSPAPAVKGEAVASWVPSVQELHNAFYGEWPAAFNAGEGFDAIRVLVYQRAPKVDVVALWGSLRHREVSIADLRAALAKQSIPTAEVEGGRTTDTKEQT